MTNEQLCKLRELMMGRPEITEMIDEVLNLRDIIRKWRALPRVRGVARVLDNSKVLDLHFERRPTDDEMRNLHDLLGDPEGK